MRSFNSARSYYFRAACTEIDMDHAQYGGQSLEDLCLEDFRSLFVKATSQATNYVLAATNRYNPATRSWDRPFRRIIR